MTENTEHTDVDHLQDFQARALGLATMFKALMRLAQADSYTGMGTDDEIRLVAAQGERMAQELSDDIDQFETHAVVQFAKDALGAHGQNLKEGSND